MSLLAFVIQLLPTFAILSVVVSVLSFNPPPDTKFTPAHGRQSVLGSHAYQKNK